MYITRFFVPAGVAEREEQHNCPVGPEQQAPVTAGRREEELRTKHQTHPRTTGWYQRYTGGKESSSFWLFSRCHLTVNPTSLAVQQSQRDRQRSWRDFSLNWSSRVKLQRGKWKTSRKRFLMQRPKMTSKNGFTVRNRNDSSLLRGICFNSFFCCCYTVDLRMTSRHRNKRQRRWTTSWWSQRRRTKSWNPISLRARVNVRHGHRNIKLCWSGGKKRRLW